MTHINIFDTVSKFASLVNNKIIEYSENKFNLSTEIVLITNHLVLKNFDNLTVNDSSLQSENEALSDSKIKKEKKQ